jgi:hypothetical protein
MRLRRVGGLLACCLAGCLYVGGINYPPEGEVQLDRANPVLGETVVLSAEVSDPDGDEVHYEWEVDVTPDGGAPYTLGLTDQASDGGAGPAPTILQPLSESLSAVQLTIADRGSYEVRLKAVDEQGAHRVLTTSFVVANQPPTIGLLLDVEPSYKLADHFPDTGFEDGVERNPIHAHYQLRLKEGATDDHEGDLACGKAASIEWVLLEPDKALLAYWEQVPCKEGELLDRLRFRLDGAKATQKTELKIKAVVDDGHGGTAEQTLALELAPNRPACIQGLDGTSPPVLPEGSSLKTLVVAQDGAHFEVTWPDDDVDEGFRYTWWVREPGASAFGRLQQGTKGGTYDMPPWFRVPGEEVELRVVIQDQLSTALPSCSGESLLCRDGLLPKDCYQWVTWKVKFY